MTHQRTRKSRPDIWEAYYAPTPLLPHIGNRRRGGMAKTLATVLVLLGLIVLVPNSKPALSQGVQLVKVDVSVVAKGYRASKLIGTNVVNDKNERVGKIDDIIVDNKNVMFAVLQVGGFLGLASHLVALPYDSLKIADDGKKIELPGASKDELKKLAEFKYQA